jgi:hypothetical protein
MLSPGRIPVAARINTSDLFTRFGISSRQKGALQVRVSVRFQRLCGPAHRERKLRLNLRIEIMIPFTSSILGSRPFFD